MKLFFYILQARRHLVPMFSYQKLSQVHYLPTYPRKTPVFSADVAHNLKNVKRFACWKKKCHNSRIKIRPKSKCLFSKPLEAFPLIVFHGDGGIVSRVYRFLALVCLMQAEHFNNKEGLIEYNVGCFGKTLKEVFRRPSYRAVGWRTLMQAHALTPLFFCVRGVLFWVLNWWRIFYLLL